MKITTIRIEKKIAENIKKTFGVIEKGAHAMFTGWFAIQKRMMYELKEKFSKKELQLLIELQNSHILSPDACSPDMLSALVQDGCTYDGLDEKWKVNKDTLIEKVQKLSFSQSLILQTYLNNFWYGSKEEKNMDDYLSILI